MYYTPLQLTLRRLDLNKYSLAAELNLHHGTVFSWQRKGGKIPEQYHDKILELAQKRHKKLIKILSDGVITKQELFLGGEDEE